MNPVYIQLYQTIDESLWRRAKSKVRPKANLSTKHHIIESLYSSFN